MDKVEYSIGGGIGGLVDLRKVEAQSYSGWYDIADEENHIDKEQDGGRVFIVILHWCVVV